MSEPLRVWLTDRIRGTTAHRRPDCTFLANRPAWAAAPVDVEAESLPELRGGSWVAIEVVSRGRVRTRTVRVCPRCGDG